MTEIRRELNISTEDHFVRFAAACLGLSVPCGCVLGSHSITRSALHCFTDGAREGHERCGDHGHSGRGAAADGRRIWTAHGRRPQRPQVGCASVSHPKCSSRRGHPSGNETKHTYR